MMETPLAAHLGRHASLSVAYQGAFTPRIFSSLDQELTSLTTTAGIYDLGHKACLQITGADRLRWLNGMVTNTIQALPEGHWNYNFLLNAQGRIQGDANIYRTRESLILQTDRSQVGRLSAHLDHFIIMDDVELHPLDASQTAIGIAGPHAAKILVSLGADVPEEGVFAATSLSEISITLVHAYSPLVPRFEIWLAASALPQLWASLQAAGATPCGAASADALRILEATPLYGVDIQERHLAQETSQERALNFNKGCYLGQEIVERIRSRATVHRGLRQFSVDHAPAVLHGGEKIEINAEGAERNPVGELTSVAHFALPAFTGALALGFIRADVIERNLPLTHDGGTATVLQTPPALPD
ncbi:MAG TPA: folate-binding protein [Silvibacterium sp.]|nr:folate-binding protein [Silvibacterium sp.]